MLVSSFLPSQQSQPMPYHYGAGSSDIEWWPDGNEDGNQGDEPKSQALQSWSSSPSDDGWNYDVRYVAILLQTCLLSYCMNIAQKGCIRSQLWKLL